jgi:hypothetical protein
VNYFSGSIFRTNKKMFKQGFLLLLIFFHLFLCSQAQEPTITLGKSTIALNEEFTITLNFPKDKKKQFQSFIPQLFPSINDMIKTRTTYIKDETTKEFKIIQYYKPRQEGVAILNPFTLMLAEKPVQSNGTKIRIKAQDPEIKSIPEPDDKDLEFKKLKEEMFLKVTVNKSSVYWNEGVNVSIAFYNSFSNPVELTLIDLNKQLTEIRKKIRPLNCWIEDLESKENITLDTISIDNKKYNRWMIYAGEFYPLDTAPIFIPPLDFKIIKYNIAKSKESTTFFRKYEEVKYSTPAYRLPVKSLPPHPHKDQVSVGFFKLGETISASNLITGKSFNYNFILTGEGNISAIVNPGIKDNEVFEFYSPEVSQEIIRKNNGVIGAKVFKYFILPKEPGQYPLKNYIYWIYFNPYSAKYDTLFSSLTLTVKGESQKNNYISSNDLGTFYNTLDKESNSLRHMEKDEFIKLFANFIILFMLVTTAILILRK